ncbi:MAG: glycosyl transferase [Pseudozobellia sp.]|nr:glycosyl transferase [Pseudozobellia sp.]MBG50378.1 glycosyl transferase [Pseudozobellia sp.]
MLIKVVFAIPSLRAGGAEKVMSFLAQNLDTNKFESHLLVIESQKASAYEIEGIKLTYLNKPNVRSAIPDIYNFIKKEKPEIVMSAIAHLNTMMAFLSPFFPKTRFIGRETTVSSENNFGKSTPLLLKPLFKLKPKLLDCIVCQSNDMRDDLLNNYNYPKEKLVTINNPVTKSFVLKEKKENSSRFELITVARLVPQKGHLRLIEILAKFNAPFRYTIIGEGKELENVFSTARLRNIDEKIRHIPYSDKVGTFLAESDMFLSGSYVEGFPNAFIESCAVGTPVLTFDAKGGINEIIVNNLNGFVVKSNEEFLEKLKESFSKNWDGKKIRDSVISKYGEEIILSEYERLFLRLTKNS